MTDDQQRAKELLAAQLPEGDELIADILADNFDLQFLDKETVIAAITAALRAAPEGFVLVPVVPTPEMDAHGRHALSKNGVDSVDDSDALVCWSAMLAARPQGVKDV